MAYQFYVSVYCYLTVSVGQESMSCWAASLFRTAQGCILGVSQVCGFIEGQSPLPSSMVGRIHFFAIVKRMSTCFFKARRRASFFQAPDFGEGLDSLLKAFSNLIRLTLPFDLNRLLSLMVSLLRPSLRLQNPSIFAKYIAQSQEWYPITLAIFYWPEANYWSCPHSRGGSHTRVGVILEFCLPALASTSYPQTNITGWLSVKLSIVQ